MTIEALDGVTFPVKGEDFVVDLRQRPQITPGFLLGAFLLLPG